MSSGLTVAPLLACVNRSCRVDKPLCRRLFLLVACSASAIFRASYHRRTIHS